MRYRVAHLAMDLDGLTDGDWDDFRRELSTLEMEFPGVHILGFDATDSWPTVTTAESGKKDPP